MRRIARDHRDALWGHVWVELSLSTSEFAQRLPDDPPTRGCCRHRDEDRQPYVSGDGDHGVSREGGTLEMAAAMAIHASTRTTQLYDQRGDETSLDDFELVVI